MLVPQTDHISDDQKSIFRRFNTPTYVTMADVMHIKHFTEFQR
jgi:hypothetical protein